MDNPLLIAPLVFLLLATPVLIDRYVSTDASGRWLLGLVAGAVGYGFLMALILISRNASDDTAPIILFAGSQLGAMTALSFGLKPQESRSALGILCGVVAFCALIFYSLDFWSYLELPLPTVVRLSRALSLSLPGLLWSELLLLRAAWLIRAGRGLHPSAKSGAPGAPGTTGPI